LAKSLKIWVKWRLAFAEKQIKAFLEVTPKRSSVHDLCGRKFVGKSRTTTFWASLGKFGQRSFAPPKFCLLLHLWLQVRENEIPLCKWSGGSAQFRTKEAGAGPANNVKVGYFSGS